MILCRAYSPQGRRVGDVEDAVEAMALQARGERRMVLAVSRDGLHAGGEPLGAPAAVEHGDLVAVGEQLANEMQADELRAAHDEGAHDRRILAQGENMARPVEVSWLGNLKTEARIGPHRLLVDEPVANGGEDTGPTPPETLLAALGA